MKAILRFTLIGCLIVIHLQKSTAQVRMAMANIDHRSDFFSNDCRNGAAVFRNGYRNRP